MKELPIYYRAPSADAMIRATLADAKTHLRLPMERQPTVVENWSEPGVPGLRLLSRKGKPVITSRWVGGALYGWDHYGPFSQPGDHLWVRECWATYSDAIDPEPNTLLYRADMSAYWDMRPHRKMPADFNPLTDARPPYKPKWKPSIHMPRWASRIKLLVKRVWVERLQNISEDDARAEGAGKHAYSWPEGTSPDNARDCGGSHRNGFRNLWDAIYASKLCGWDANPWVWACEFERERDAR